MKRIVICLFSSICFCAAAFAGGGFKSVSDGVKSATEVIQKAIDDCAAKGGGEVVLPAGKYLCRTVYLRSGVTLNLSRGATIIGERDFSSYAGAAIICGEDITNAGICGDGTIDGAADYKE